MSAASIVSQWAEYVLSLDALPDRAPQDAIAFVFERDAIEISPTGGRLKIPGLGWVECPAMSVDLAFEWLALIREGGSFHVLPGTGPVFCEENREGLPSKDGVYHVLPGVWFESNSKDIERQQLIAINAAVAARRERR